MNEIREFCDQFLNLLGNIVLLVDASAGAVGMLLCLAKAFAEGAFHCTGVLLTKMEVVMLEGGCSF